MSLQSELAGKIKELYPNALIKKVDKDNYVDIHLPDVHKKLGTHLFFNIAKGKIKMGFYCRDEEFVKKTLEFSDKVEKYSQGVRLADNPEFTSVDDAIAAASEFINLLLLKAEKQKETQHDSNISSEPQNGIVEKEADSGADHFIKIVLYGKGSEFVQGLITQDEFKIYQDFKDKNNLKDDEVAWPAFLEEKSISAERETDKSQYWDYDDVSRFTGINLDSMEIVIYDDNNEVIDTYDYSGFAMQFEESINKNSKILTKNVDMEVFVLYLMLCLLVCLIASKKKIGKWQAFLLSFFFTPIIGLIITFFFKRVYEPPSYTSLFKSMYHY